MGVGNKADCKDAKTDCATAVAMLVTSAVDSVELIVLSTAPEVVELSCEVVTEEQEPHDGYECDDVRQKAEPDVELLYLVV